MSQREGPCPEPVSLPFLLYPRGRFLKRGLPAGWICPLPTQDILYSPFFLITILPLKTQLLHAATQDLTWKAFSLLLYSTLYMVWGREKEHRMESGWEPGSPLGLHPAPSGPQSPGLTEMEAGLWAQLLPPHSDAPPGQAALVLLIRP